VNQDLNVLALFKGSERFVFVFDDASRDELLATIRNAAADPNVTLNWFDAAVLTERARQQATTAEEAVDDNADELPTRR
jgi:hypothetical protein